MLAPSPTRLPGRVRRARHRLAPLVLVLLGAPYAAGATLRPAAADLADLTLEQLGNVIVTTVSRRPEPVGSAAASIYVISRDDIRRSGATTLPEALRLAPNLHVGRADANQYGITARGSNSIINNKMLVMIDGRTVYSPSFSGVFWEAQDVLLEDVDRIEVISGPGATLWGLNAVNGVISVITRAAGSSNGLYAEAGAGDREAGAAVRYGGAAGRGAARFYAKGMTRRHSETPSGTAIRDESERGQAGFRYDVSTPGRAFTLQGDAYTGRIDQAPSPRDIWGANLLGRWSAALTNDTALTVQAYYDHTYRNQPGVFRQSLDTVDAIVQLGLRPRADHSVLLGAGYRYANDRSETPGPALAFLPAHKSLSWAHAFVQDEITVRDGLQLTLGAKVETNVYTGAEFLPNLRLAWRPVPHRLFWGALTRAVRAPARIDRELYQPARPPHVFLNGGPDFESEVADVVEIGYREQPSASLYWSVTLFGNDFDRIRSVEPRPGGPRTENGLHGRVQGIEAWGEWRVIPAWRLAVGAVRQHVEFERDEGSRDVAGLASLSFDPEGWWTLRSSHDLPHGIEFDLFVRRVGSLPAVRVPAYTAFDARLGWRPAPPLEISLTVQNLFDPGHVEWGPAVAPAEHPRTVFVRATWRQ